MIKNMGDYLRLENLEIYQIARELSKQAWNIYLKLEVDQKIMMGQQFIKSVDSVSANISEGYGRYHFLDKIRFYYNARPSLLESINWLELMNEREIINDNKHELFYNKANELHAKLNAFIKYNLEKKNSNS